MRVLISRLMSPCRSSAHASVAPRHGRPAEGKYLRCHLHAQIAKVPNDFVAAGLCIMDWTTPSSV